MQCLTIYVLPIVFLKKKAWVSVKLGINILFKKFFLSIPFLALIIILYAIKFIAEYFGFKAYAAIQNLWPVFGIAYGYNLINSYMQLILFNAVTILLLNQNLLHDENMSKYERKFSNHCVHMNECHRTLFRYAIEMRMQIGL